MQGLLDAVLNERFVDEGQHLLGLRLGGGQEASASPAAGNTALRTLETITYSLRGRGGITNWRRVRRGPAAPYWNGTHRLRGDERVELRPQNSKTNQSEAAEAP
jgi:hypothetical protein